MLFLSMLVFPFLSNNTLESKKTPKESSLHPIIYINGNSELDAFPNKTGSGTQLDPYDIEDLTIDCHNEWISAIKIENTDRFLILRNLTITRSIGSWFDLDAGIALIDCANVNVTQCYFTLNRFSTRLAAIQNCYIYNNTSHDNYSGLYSSDPVDAVHFFNNTCYNNSEGIHIDGGANVEFYDNNLFQNDLGIYVLYASQCEIRKNEIYDSMSGIYLRENGNTRVFNNSIQNCTNGIDLFKSSFNILNNNSINECDYGIYLDQSSYNYIRDNFFWGNGKNIEEENSHDNSESLNLHPKIVINGNSELDAFENKTGEGTTDDPYNIRDLYINANWNGSAILIQNTDKYLIMENITAVYSGGGWDSGIQLRNCKNIIIRKCRLFQNGIGIIVDYSINCEILNNNLTDAGGVGISLEQSQNLVVRENVITTSENSINLDNSNNNEIVSNTISNSELWEGQSGIYLWASSNNHISENQIEHTQIGIYINDISTNNDISNNQILGLGNVGIYLTSSSDSNIISQNVIANQLYGISLEDASENIIKKNLIQYNSVGIYLSSSDFNKIVQNRMIDNEIDIEVINCYGNTIREYINWWLVSLFIILGSLALGAIIYTKVYVPLRKKTSPKRYLRNINRLMTREKYSHALKYIELYLKIIPNSEIVITKKLLVLYNLQRFDEVLKCLEQVMKKNPDFAVPSSMKDKIEQIQIHDYVNKAMKIIDEESQED
jgi:parallel beta-helix repeat protein